MQTAGVLGAVALGVPAGWFAALSADLIATPRYAEGAPGHDPDDLALAPLRAPTTPAVRAGAAIATAASWALIVNELHWSRFALPFCALALALVIGAVIDLQYLRLPNVVTYGSAIEVLVIIAAVTLSLDLPSSLPAREGILAAVLGGVAYSGALLGFSLLAELIMRRQGLGLGDVKLALSLGASVGWLGWLYRTEEWAIASTRLVVYAALFGSIAGALGGIALTRLQPKRHFPYGPFLAIGWLVTVLMADSLIA